MTVTLKLHDFGLPDWSVAVQVTSVVPTLKLDPDGRSQVTVTGPPRLSLAVGAGYVTTAELCPAAPFTVTFAGQVIVGGVVSVVVNRTKLPCSFPAGDAPPGGVSALRLGPAAFCAKIRNCVPTGALPKLKIALI